MNHKGTNGTLDRSQSHDGAGSGTVYSETLNRLSANKLKLIAAAVLLATLVIWLFTSLSSKSIGLFDRINSKVNLLVDVNGGAWIPPRDLNNNVYAITKEEPEHNYYLEIHTLPASSVVRMNISRHCDVHAAIDRIFLNDGEDLICLDYNATEQWRRSGFSPVGNMLSLHMLENNGNILLWKDMALCGIDRDGLTSWEYEIGSDYPTVVCTKDSQYIYMAFPTKIVVFDSEGNLVGRVTGGFNSRELVWAIDSDGNLIAARLYQYDYQGIIQRVEPSGIVTTIATLPKDESTVRGQRDIRGLACDAEGNIWIGSGVGLHVLDKKESKVVRIQETETTNITFLSVNNLIAVEHPVLEKQVLERSYIELIDNESSVVSSYGIRDWNTDLISEDDTGNIYHLSLTGSVRHLEFP